MLTDRCFYRLWAPDRFNTCCALHCAYCTWLDSVQWTSNAHSWSVRSSRVVHSWSWYMVTFMDRISLHSCIVQKYTWLCTLTHTCIYIGTRWSNELFKGFAVMAFPLGFYSLPGRLGVTAIIAIKAFMCIRWQTANDHWVLGLRRIIVHTHYLPAACLKFFTCWRDTVRLCCKAHLNVDWTHILGIQLPYLCSDQLKWLSPNWNDRISGWKMDG